MAGRLTPSSVERGVPPRPRLACPGQPRGHHDRGSSEHAARATLPGEVQQHRRRGLRLGADRVQLQTAPSTSPTTLLSMLGGADEGIPDPIPFLFISARHALRLQDPRARGTRPRTPCTPGRVPATARSRAAIFLRPARRSRSPSRCSTGGATRTCFEADVDPAGPNKMERVDSLRDRGGARRRSRSASATCRSTSSRPTRREHRLQLVLLGRHARVQLRPGGLTEQMGKFIDEGGSNFWGVEQSSRHRRGSGCSPARTATTACTSSSTPGRARPGRRSPAAPAPAPAAPPPGPRG